MREWSAVVVKVVLGIYSSSSDLVEVSGKSLEACSGRESRDGAGGRSQATRLKFRLRTDSSPLTCFDLEL